ncbi:MAG: hypothetical protein ACLUQ6_01470, partial [Alistipes onderdonkii]
EKSNSPAIFRPSSNRSQPYGPRGGVEAAQGRGAESLTRKIQLDIAQKQQEMQAKTADNGNGLKIENAEVVDEVVRPSKSEPLSAASGNQEEPPKEREHVVPPPESDFYSQSYSSRAVRDEHEGQRAEVIKSEAV